MYEKLLDLHLDFYEGLFVATATTVATKTSVSTATATVATATTVPTTTTVATTTTVNNTTTIDNTIDEVLDTRVTRLFELLDDEFRLHVVSLDTAKKAGEEQFYTEGMNEDDIMKKIASQESKNKKVQKR